MPYGMRGRLLWTLPLLRGGFGRGIRPAPQRAVRRARARLKSRRALANLLFDTAEAALEELERDAPWWTAPQTGAGARREPRGIGGRAALRQQWRSAGADRIAGAAEAWKSGEPARLADIRGAARAQGSPVADYDV